MPWARQGLGQVVRPVGQGRSGPSGLAWVGVRVGPWRPPWPGFAPGSGRPARRRTSPRHRVGAWARVGVWAWVLARAWARRLGRTSGPCGVGVRVRRQASSNRPRGPRSPVGGGQGQVRVPGHQVIGTCQGPDQACQGQAQVRPTRVVRSGQVRRRQVPSRLGPYRLSVLWARVGVWGQGPGSGPGLGPGSPGPGRQGRRPAPGPGSGRRRRQGQGRQGRRTPRSGQGARRGQARSGPGARVRLVVWTRPSGSGVSWAVRSGFVGQSSGHCLALPCWLAGQGVRVRSGQAIRVRVVRVRTGTGQDRQTVSQVICGQALSGPSQVVRYRPCPDRQACPTRHPGASGVGSGPGSGRGQGQVVRPGSGDLGH